MKAVITISTFLGISVFTFGILKFFDPFKGWYSVQIIKSGLNEFSYWLGIAGEIFAGVLFLGSMIVRERLTPKAFRSAILLASVSVIVMMVTAVVVHLNPSVPSDVLPLKIKSPIIPGFFLLLAFSNIVLALRPIRGSGVKTDSQ